MKNLNLSTFTLGKLRRTLRRNPNVMTGAPGRALSSLGLPLAFLLVAAVPSCGDSDNPKDGGTDARTDGGSDARDARDAGTGGRVGTGGTSVGTGGAGGGTPATGGATSTGGASAGGAGGFGGFGGAATGGRGGVGGTAGAATGGRGGFGGFGGRGTGGAGTGGAATGGRGTGGAGTGGAATGGAGTGGAGTGGAGTGGAGTGGAGTGGAGTGGAGTGGAGTGGAGTGGAGTGGAATGGAGTGGSGTGGAATGGSGTGGAATGGAGGAGGMGGSCPAATFTTALLQNFENFMVVNGGPGESFTSPQGFTGNFTGDPGGAAFVLVTPGANADMQAIQVTNPGGPSFIYTASSNTCLSLAGSTGITFFARGTGALRVAMAGSTNRGTMIHTVAAALTGTFTQYSVLWSDVGPVPMLSPTENIAIFAEGATATTASSLAIDNVSFTTGP